MSVENNNAAIYFVDRHARGSTAEKSAFIESDGRNITYSGLKSRTDKMVGLCKTHGLRREDRVAMLVLDTIEFPVIFLGSMKAGVVPIALNTLLSTDVYDTILGDSRPRALFVSVELLAVVAPILGNHPHLEKIFVIDDNGEHLDFNTELEAADAGECVQASADECAFWLYSSGSTGKPKGVRHVHGSLQYTADTYGSQVLGIRSDDIVFSAAKLFFAYGLGNSLSFPMSVGATTILYKGRPTPDAVVDVIEKHKPTIFCGVPTLYAATIPYLQKLDALPDAPIRACISAGEALPEEVGKQWHNLWKVDILDGVGSTEMLHIFLSNAPGNVVYGTSGTAVPGYELRLVDEAGNDVKDTENVGELLVCGESAASDYWNQREKSRSTFEGKWTRTGDKYTKTKDGRFVYCGRTDDMFKVSGIWVSPFEVEQALVSHESVMEAAVVPAEDDEGLQKPKAFVILNEGASADNLRESLKEHVKEKIGKWKYPRWVEVVEDLPKTATGKIQRFKLKDPA